MASFHPKSGPNKPPLPPRQGTKPSRSSQYQNKTPDDDGPLPPRRGAKSSRSSQNQNNRPDDAHNQPSGARKQSFLTREQNPDLLFDEAWYRTANPGAKKGTLRTYLSTGWRKLRSPHPLFFTKYYLERCPDLEGLQQEPLSHFI